MATPFKVKAVFEYASAHDDDLKFPVGQIITVTEEEDDDWYTGEYVDESGAKQEGLFPRNFVEKYEPTAPPRPTRRSKKEAEQASGPAVAPEELAASSFEPAAEPEAEPAQQEVEAASPSQASPPKAPIPKPAEPVPLASPPPTIPKAEAAAPSSPPAPKAAPARAKAGGPPPVSEKPASSSFRDRIAAFNKPAAPPIAPFKPGGLGSGSSGFIKKPFVAPPPKGNAYVPPPQSAPTARVYHHHEDPEVKEMQAENLEMAGKAGLVPAEANEGEAEKPMSLKERMALLQKQQLEQAQRHADAVAKKDKPKRPPKRVESHEGTAEPPPMLRRDTEETSGRGSTDEAHPPRIPHPPRRKSSKGLVAEYPDGNEADMSGAGDTTEGQEDELTEKEDSDEKTKQPPRTPVVGAAAEEEEEEEEDEEDAEEDSVDPEVRRKEELRQRMAKMSGGMGFHGMFGPPGMMSPPGAAPALPKKKRTSTSERRTSERSEEVVSPGSGAPPVPAMMALPGMSTRRSEERTLLQEEPTAASGSAGGEEEEDDEHEDAAPPPRTPSLPSRSAAGPPPVPGGRPAPPPVPSETRPRPPPPPVEVKSPSEGSESDDELSERPDIETPRGEAGPAGRAPPPPPVSMPPAALQPTSPITPGSAQRSYLLEGASPASPPPGPAPTTPGKRNSRPPPPIPGTAPAMPPAPAVPPAQTRAPPPPPPGALSRQSTTDNRPLSPSRAFAHNDDEGEDEEVTEYEGDYDTDIASSVPHKDALKSHVRESNMEDSGSMRSPIMDAPPSMPPPVPSASRAPPPIPSQPPPDTKRSTDMPRAAPPPPPPPKEDQGQQDDEYDPYSYAAPWQGIPAPGYAPPPPKAPAPAAEDAYSPPDLTLSYPGAPQNRAPPPAPPSGRAPPRQSLDVGRAATGGRRSMDVSRPSIESGFVANDVDLARQSGWWLQPNSLPPQLQGRKDIFFESEESQASHPGGKTEVTKDIFVLYQDYSQTIITVRFDPSNPSDVHMEQRHEPPPRSLRQDQLEQSYERFGRQLGEAVGSKKDSVVGDGTPQALVHELLRPFKDALLPVGRRAYGALVYSNLANASTSQNDEIRAGDIISIRNARFQGKHGAMHAKYSMEVGKPDHVAVVSEWDGTKKKVRAWEQGRESKKVKLESFKLEDLRSGEVKVWRVMPRSWVGWEGQN